jgi:hypothetical protein
MRGHVTNDTALQNAADRDGRLEADERRVFERQARPDRRAGDDTESDGVDGANKRRGLFDTQLASFHRSIVHDEAHCATIW